MLGKSQKVALVLISGEMEGFAFFLFVLLETETYLIGLMAELTIFNRHQNKRPAYMSF